MTRSQEVWPFKTFGSEAPPPLSAWLEAHFHDWFERAAVDRQLPQMRQLWERAILEPALSFLDRPGKHFRARLVTRAWAIAGGTDAQMPVALPVVVEVLHAGSLIVDDVQDGACERRGAPALHHLFGAPLAINTGNLLYCWALDLLATVDLDAARQLELHRRTVGTMLQCHQGQALDVSVRICDIPQPLVPGVVAASTELKTGALMQLASVIGAIAAGADARRVAALGIFGRALGTGLQMLDDLSGLLNQPSARKAQTDLRLARPTWAWAWLATDLDADEFWDLQQEGRAITEGRDPSELIRRMALRLDLSGRQRVRRHLQASLAEIQRDLEPSPHLAALRQDVEQLEQSYV